MTRLGRPPAGGGHLPVGAVVVLPGRARSPVDDAFDLAGQVGTLLVVEDGTSDAWERVTRPGVGAARPVQPPAGSLVAWRLALPGGLSLDAWARRTAPRLATAGPILVPASGEGATFAALLARALGRPSLARVHRLDRTGAAMARFGGRMEERSAVPPTAVLSIVAGGEVDPVALGPRLERLSPDRRCEVPTGSTVAERTPAAETDHGAAPAPLVVGEHPPDPGSRPLAEADVVVVGGGGLGGPAAFADLVALAEHLRIAVGATRVAVDAGWAPADRQVGTTGTEIRPRLYVGIGVSGALHHLSGVRQPARVVAIDRDPSTPLMRAADLAIVADGPETLRAARQLLAEVDVETGSDA